MGYDNNAAFRSGWDWGVGMRKMRQQMVEREEVLQAGEMMTALEKQLLVDDTKIAESKAELDKLKLYAMEHPDEAYADRSLGLKARHYGMQWNDATLAAQKRRMDGLMAIQAKYGNNARVNEMVRDRITAAGQQAAQHSKVITQMANELQQMAVTFGELDLKQRGMAVRETQAGAAMKTAEANERQVALREREYEDRAALGLEKLAGAKDLTQAYTGLFDLYTMEGEQLANEEGLLESGQTVAEYAEQKAMSRLKAFGWEDFIKDEQIQSFRPGAEDSGAPAGGGEDEEPLPDELSFDPRTSGARARQRIVRGMESGLAAGAEAAAGAWNTVEEAAGQAGEYASGFFGGPTPPPQGRSAPSVEGLEKRIDSILSAFREKTQGKEKK